MTVTVESRPTGHPGYSQTLPRKAESAAVARKLVRAALLAWHLKEDRVVDATLVMTELVSNAVDHSRLPSIRVLVNRPTESLIRLGVVDRSKTIPTMRTESEGNRIRGRGLLIVEALTDRWGTDLYSWGKQVWGEMRAEHDR
ncbi:ATP-binding protein [Streptomyces sp. NPDC047097]|uniref:ATP-binding protein n=1 Tax=Streptomyces sp. NPDC047097 TaxID=3155260 RepID=UPI0033F67A20